jgi:hypothetical protein
MAWRFRLECMVKWTFPAAEWKTYFCISQILYVYGTEKAVMPKKKVIAPHRVHGTLKIGPSLPLSNDKKKLKAKFFFSQTYELYSAQIFCLAKTARTCLIISSSLSSSLVLLLFHLIYKSKVTMITFINISHFIIILHLCLVIIIFLGKHL